MTMMTTNSAGVRSPSIIVPLRAARGLLTRAATLALRLIRMNANVARFYLPLAEHAECGQHCFDESIGSGVLFCISTSCREPSIFSSSSSLFTN